MEVNKETKFNDRPDLWGKFAVFLLLPKGKGQSHE